MPNNEPGSIYSPDTSWGRHLRPQMAGFPFERCC